MFSNRALPVYRLYSEDFAIGDVDGDNDLDIYWANGAIGGLQQNGLWRNDGNYTFTDITATHLPAFLDASVGVELADMDGDGDLDAVVAGLG